MTTRRAVDSGELEPGRAVLVHGVVRHARVHSPSTRQDVLRDPRRSWKRLREGDWAITLDHAHVAFADHDRPTAEERYVAERLYEPRGAPAPRFAHRSGGHRPVVRPLVHGRAGDPVELPGEVPAGTPVTVVLRVYQPPRFPGTRGLHLEQVLLRRAPTTDPAPTRRGP